MNSLRSFAGSDVIDDQHRRKARDQRDRREVLEPVIRQVLADHGAHHAGDGVIEQRVAVGRGAHDRVDADGAAGAALVLHHHLLAEHVGELLRGHARGEIDAAAGRQRNDELDRPRRIAVLRRRRMRRERECGEQSER